jgi:Fe-S-cluster containining protein
MSDPASSTSTHDAEAFDCQTCGACCVEAGAVILDEEDDVPASLVQHVANLRCMITEGTSFRCAALLGTVGEAVGCGIYGRRPTVCRLFDAGSDECLSARDAMQRRREEPGALPPGYEIRSMPGPTTAL